MNNHNNIYNILGKLSALEPKAAPTKNILNELAEPAPMKDLASQLNERYIAEKDMGKHNNATTGFKALAKKVGGGEKGERIAGAQFQKMKKAGQLEERQVDEISDQLAYNANQARAGQHFAAKDAADAAHKSWASGDNSSMKQAQNVSTTAQAARDAKSKLSRNTELQKSRGDRLGKQMYEPATGQSRSTPQSMGTADGGLTRMKKPAQQMNHTYEESLEMDEDMLSPKQKKIAGLRPPPDKIDGKDLAALRGSKKTEGSKVDQNKDGKNDFEDVKIARMKASGAMKETANDEFAKARADKQSVEDDQWAASKGKGAGAEKVAGKAKNDKRDAQDRMWAAGKGVTEDSLDSHDDGEYDREGEMASQDLETAEDAAEELRSILSADENLPEWVQAKITKAVDYLDTARDYMQSKDDNVPESVDYEKAIPQGVEDRHVKFKCPHCGTATPATRMRANNYECPSCHHALPIKNQMGLAKQVAEGPDLQEGWDDMMKAVKDRADQGTGKFDVQKTSTGTRYTRKADTFADAGDDGETKASDGPKKKGRPKKNTGPERVTAKAYKHKGGRVSESVKLDTFVEDTLAEMAAILNTKAPAAKQQKFMGMVRTQKVNESMLTESGLEAICHRYGKECKDFMTSGDMHDDLFHALYDHYFDDMPYGVKKARDGDPYEWVADRFHADMGGDEHDAGPGSLSTLPRSIDVELDESGAFHPGRTVYYRGKAGTVDRVNGNQCFVHVGDGDMDVWPTDRCSTEKQSMMSTLGNDIKDIGHGMKGFLSGGPEERELDELAKLAGLGQHKLGEATCNMTAEGAMCPKHGMAECWSSGGGMMEAKGSKPDFLDMDKDGDKEEPMKKAIGDKKKPASSNAFTQTAPYPSFKKKKPFGDKKEELDECDMPGPMSPMGSMPSETESGMNISGSLDTKTGKKTLNVSADGDAAEELAQMLKMAGMLNGAMDGGDSHEQEPHVTGKVVLIHPQGNDGMMGEAYANEPDETYADTESITDQGGDLNRKKKQYKHSYKQGDNPEAIAETARLEAKLSRLYDSLKVKK